MGRTWLHRTSAVPRVAPAVVETGPGREGDPSHGQARASQTHSHTLAHPAQTVVPLVLVLLRLALSQSVAGPGTVVPMVLALLRLALSPSVAGPWIMQSATGTPAAVIVAIIEHTVPGNRSPASPPRETSMPPTLGRPRTQASTVTAIDV